VRRRPLSLLAVAATAALVAVPAAAGAATAHHAARPASRAVPGVLAGLARATLEHPAAAGHRMTVGIGLAGRDPSGEQALIAAENDKASPDFHHFLTPSQFDARFGVPAATVAQTRSWLTGGGLTVDSVSADGTYVQASGTVAQLDKVFAVHIGSYTDKKDGAFLANDVAPTVPAAIPVTSVLGLDTIQRMQTSELSGHALPSAPAAGTFSGVLQPRDLWSIYDEPASDEGEGQAIGIFGEGETDSVVTQLRLFEQHEKLPKIPVRVVHTEGGTDDAYADNTGSIEWYLDVQASTGMAPKASQLDLYFAKSLFDADIAASFSNWVNDPNGPKQMNASFGECETSPTNPVTGPLAQIPYGTELGDELEPVAEPMLEKAAAMGRTLFASAGDTGSGCPEVVVPVAGAGNGVAPQPVPITNYPCASAYAVCVGGTVIETDGTDHGKRVSEDAWMDTGGGPSHFILEPSYQKKTAYITATNAPCLTDPSGSPYPTGSICRGTPDVAALSGNILGNGYVIYIDGSPGSEGGTSLSSPLMMGMWARLQAAAPTSAGLGFANDTFYGQADKGAATYARDFTDITATDSEQTAGVSTTNGFYPAEPGYDFVSGLGALNVANLLTDVDGTTTARSPQGASAPPQVVSSTVSMHSPTGNASDPLVVSTGNLPAIDLSGASLTTSPDGSTVTATLTGPALSATPDPLATTGGEDFYVYWYDAAKDTVYYVHAHTDAAAGVTYSAGSTTGGSYTDIAAAGATGSFTGTTLKVTAKLAALGAPKKGDLLGDPAAITQLGAGVPVGVITLLSFTADSASYPSVSAANAGDAVCVGGCDQPVTATPAGSTAPTGTTAPSSGSSSSPTADLAFTGLSAVVPIVALLLVVAGLAGLCFRRRRSLP
jgi:hypothetical protein